jgi:hypothetical protein
MIPIAEYQGFSSRILNGPFAGALYQRSYLELSDNICLKLNQCWVQSPNLRYFAAKIFAGAILYNVDTSEALLITSIEVYGRTVSVDVHHENPEASYPRHDTKPYKDIYPISIKTNDGLKLVIGTTVFNCLVTGSIRVDRTYPAEFGPYITNFLINTRKESTKIQTFIDKNVHEEAKKPVDNPHARQIQSHRLLYQIRQLRSKFDHIETYEKCRATFDMFNFTHHQPLTIFTLCNYQKSFETDIKAKKKPNVS